MISSSRLIDVAEFIRDGTHGSPVRTELGIPVLSAMNVKGGALNFWTDRYTSEQEYDAFNKRLPLATGDVLLTIVGTIGRSAVVEEVLPIVFQRSVAVIRPKQGAMDSRFLYHVTQSSSFQNQLDRAANKSSQAGVYLGKLGDMEVPIPALPEQRRIAAILDQADALRAKRREALAQLDSLTQSIFIEMFGDPATNSKKWECHPLGELTEKITDGEHLNPDFSPTGMPIVMAGNVLEDSIDFSATKNVALSLGEKFRRKCKPERGDLLVVSRGATIGRMCAVDTDDAFCLMGSVILIKVKRDKLHSNFVSALLKHPVMRSALYKTSGSSAQQAIYLKDLKNLSFIKPPMEIQQRLSERVAAINELRMSHRQSLRELDILFASLQHRAFRGEL